jgi:hypothetical protein
MTKMFLVMGTTGAYSDRSEWPVAIVETRESAEKYVKAVTAQYQSIPQSVIRDQYQNTNTEKMREIMSLDPSFECDYYTGTSYWLDEVDFIPMAELSSIID